MPPKRTIKMKIFMGFDSLTMVSSVMATALPPYKVGSLVELP